MIFLFRCVKTVGSGCVVIAACILAADDMMNSAIKWATSDGRQYCIVYLLFGFMLYSLFFIIMSHKCSPEDIVCEDFRTFEVSHRKRMVKWTFNPFQSLGLNNKKTIL